MSDLKQFLELFNPYPGNHYIQVTTQTDDTTTALYELLNSKDAQLRIALYQDEEPLDIIDNYPLANIQHIKNFVHPFRALPRDNDIVIFKDIFLQHHNQSALLKTAYTTLANNSEVIIMEKKGLMDIETVLEQLDTHEYRAANYIDILPEYDLITARKLHMWGNGL